MKMTLEKRDLASFDEANSQWKVDAGNYLFKVGSDVENIRSTCYFEGGRIYRENKAMPALLRFS